MTPRERAIAWAVEMVDREALIVDTETCGKEHDAGLCDIAVVAINGRVLLNTYVDPGKPIPADASRVHGITDADVAGAPTFADLHPAITTLCSGRVVIAYNSQFDAGCINALSRAVGLPQIAQDWQCAMLAYSDFNGTLGRFGGFKWHRLGDACAAMGVILDGAHRALADAEATRRLVLAMAGVGEASDVEAVQLTLMR